MLKHNLLAAAPWREMRLAPHGDDGNVQPVTHARNGLAVEQIPQSAVAVAAEHHQIDVSPG